MSLQRNITYSETKISIVTICRNSVRTIARTIESVISQQVTGLEYVIVDGASSDGTQNVVRSFGDQIDIFVSEPDGGIADAFNKGISLSHGRIVGLINSDDILLPGALQKVTDFFSDHPDIDVLHGDVMLYEQGRFIKQVAPSGRWWFPWRLVLFNHPATFVRKEVYDRYGLFCMTYRIAMDVEIFLRWMKRRVNIAYLPEPLVGMQAGGLSGRQAIQGYREVKRALIFHGFSPVLATMQFAARFALNFIVRLQRGLRCLWFGT